MSGSSNSSGSGVAASLRAAKEALDKKDFKETLRLCKEVISKDKANFNAYLLAGLAFHKLDQDENSEQAYRKAISINGSSPHPFKGLLDLFSKPSTSSTTSSITSSTTSTTSFISNENLKKIIPVIQSLLSFNPSAFDLHCRLAKTYSALKQWNEVIYI